MQQSVAAFTQSSAERNLSRTVDVSGRFTPIKLKPAKSGQREKENYKKKQSEKRNNGLTCKGKKSTHFRLSEMTTRVQLNFR